MKINYTWSITGGNNDFILTERRAGKNPKTGEPTITEIKTFHPSIEQCAAKIATKTSGIEFVGRDSPDTIVAELRSIRDTVQEIADEKRPA